ncbi:hypothetical protein SDC9_123934 [bioreactor metagenome]|uniref:Tripartite ATP-independent periplasmic transporters DctQ component domain-containing protein n=1 Tax=bioreactor metagenome TaxID=1076179 RepID=A0A645CJ07_9ZZZZ
MRKYLKALDYFEEGILVIGFTIMIIMNFFNVVSRFLLPQTPFSYTEELTILIFIWITVFGIAFGYKRGAHTGLTILTDKLPDRMKKIVVVIGTMFSVFLMVVICITGYKMVMVQLRYGSLMPGLKISTAWGGIAIPLGGVLISIRAIQAGVVNFIKIGKESST